MAYRFGIDAGSKTVKIVILDEDGVPLHSVYQRHLSNIRETLTDVLHNLAWRYGDLHGRAAVTGSAGIALADMLGLPFVQEVVATTRAVEEAYPEADAVVELGGEDAKVMYLSGNPEQRMNATCAGGTGGFIDTIAFMLGVRSSEMSRLAGGANRIYPIASRCAVFAQTDVRPLLNSGAKKSDIAASALEAVVRQTVTGLACGRPISGTVVFLGGPFEHIPELTRRFRMALGLKRGCGIKPRDAHLFTARGAAICAGEAKGNAETSLKELEARIRSAKSPEDDLVRLEPLFSSAEEREAFEARRKAVDFPRKRLFDSEGPLYVGIDAGSTTVKMAVLDDEKNLVHSCYRPVRGDALATATEMLLEFRQAMPHTYASDQSPAWIAHATATGYGEELLRAALGVDSGIVETTAHARAALELVPDATFVFDIGGQDMKALWIRNGMISNAILNEACSSGCGSFIEGTAHSLKTTPYTFCEAALAAENPVDLGTKCTVFMTSRIRHAQKIGASMPDLAAGIAYSVVKNALYRIIGAERVGTLGDKIVVQGGAFKSDAVLRAFEKICGVEAIRPDSAHLMGAIGSALVARERAHAQAKREESLRSVESSLLSTDDLMALNVKRFSARCPGCANSCSLSVADFGGGRRLVSGNRCPKAEGFDYAPNQAPVPRAAETVADGVRADYSSASSSQSAPNAIAAEQRILGRFGDRVSTGRRGKRRIGIMNCFESYEYLPFWHTLFARLGFSVLVPDDARGERYEREALATVPAEGVCFPAKIAHTRLFDLLEAGADAVFMPHFTRAGHCAVACEYALALADAVPAFAEGKATLCAPKLSSFKASRIADSPDDVEALHQALRQLCPPETPLERGELDAAVREALRVQGQVFSQIERANERVISWLGEDEGNHAIVVAGRPYHSDPRLMREVDRMLGRLGFGILSPTSLEKWAKRAPHDPACPPWKPGKHLARLARFAAASDRIDLVCLQSFGCGYDALSLEDARDALETAGKPFTALKIDDLSDKAHISIRLRTLAESIELMGKRKAAESAMQAEREPGRPSSLQTLQISARDDGAEKAETGSDSPAVSDIWVMETPVTESDVETARREIPGDVCFTAAAVMAKTLRVVRENPQVERLHVPYICNQCLLDGLGHTVWRLCGTCPEIVWEDSLGNGDGARSDCRIARPTSSAASDAPSKGSGNAVRVGIVGNPLLCFDAFMNDNIVKLLRSLGCEVEMPDAARLFVEDVRYLDQLDTFAHKGVDCVIYLQSFGCMKAHVHARGFLREFGRRWPDMPITVVDYDPESSALNRENRIRLAVEAARRKKCGL